LLSLQRAIGNRAVAQLLRSEATGDLVRAAADEPARPLDADVRRPLEQSLGADLSGVRVHSGPASEAAAAALAARAYTIGRDIHLGREGRQAAGAERRGLLTHEAVHTVQQGSRAVALRDELRVAAPDEPAEREAQTIAAEAASGGLAMRDGRRLSRVEPALQRDLKGDYKVKHGKFTLDLTTQKHAGAKCGMSGTIKFYANDAAPDSTRIKLYQALRFEDLATGKDYVWTGAHEGRTKSQTVADPMRPGIQPGWGIDFDPTAAKPRTKLSDPAVSPYYRSWWPNVGSSQDGSKKGKAVAEASLWDYPGWDRNMRFSFETVAKADDTGFVYGSVAWGFSISDAAKGIVDNEYANGRDVTTQTTDEALKRFDEYMRNPGASTAPTK
jgi:hypothetical protein